MRADYRVVLDACVLAPANLCELLLRLAETPRLYVPLWSDRILDEVHRTQINRLGFPPELADSWREAVTTAFPEAKVAAHEKIESICDVAPEDRHVLATAIKGHAGMIVTFNLRDFPLKALKPWDIAATHPAEYLTTLYSMDAPRVVAKLDDLAVKRRISRKQLLQKLALVVPTFAQQVSDSLGESL